MTPTTYGRDFAYCLKSHGGVRGFNASLWRFLLRCTLFCHSVATFLTSVSSYEGGCGFEVEKGSALEYAVLKIIGIDKFPQNEGQWIYRVPCKNPTCIILCENRYFLTLNIAQKRDVELWHVGGNNILPIENLPKIEYPIYYLCDWDLMGLQIYERIYHQIEMIKDKASSLQLINPNGKSERIKDTEDYHRSKWDKTTELSSLTANLYSSKQLTIIQNLIKSDEWIEEEGNDIGEIINGIKSGII